jgi:uncharacterized membrane protein HdeD (DUF308 family)
MAEQPPWPAPYRGEPPRSPRRVLTWRLILLEVAVLVALTGLFRLVDSAQTWRSLSLFVGVWVVASGARLLIAHRTWRRSSGRT